MKGMVDIGEKDVVRRKAIASGKIVLGKRSLDAIRSGTVRKGDVLEAAKITAIQAVKSTPDIIPYCHPIPIESVKVDFNLSDDSLSCTVEVIAHYKTGVEMEALTAVSVAALTVYDMCKAADRAMRIEGVRLVRKSGGKSGEIVLE